MSPFLRLECVENSLNNFHLRETHLSHETFINHSLLILCHVSLFNDYETLIKSSFRLAHHITDEIKKWWVLSVCPSLLGLMRTAAAEGLKQTCLHLLFLAEENKHPHPLQLFEYHSRAGAVDNSLFFLWRSSTRRLKRDWQKAYITLIIFTWFEKYWEVFLKSFIIPHRDHTANRQCFIPVCIGVPCADSPIMWTCE